ncbi:MAG: hypothetical protein SGILL_003527, partial [Bacillariaceae sp.]
MVRAQRKLLKFDESIDFECLLIKIANKLGLESPGDGVAPNDFFQLTLGTDAAVEDTDDLEHGDSLIIKKRVSPTVVSPPSRQEHVASPNVDDTTTNTTEETRKRKADDDSDKRPDAANSNGNIAESESEEKKPKTGDSFDESDSMDNKEASSTVDNVTSNDSSSPGVAPLVKIEPSNDTQSAQADNANPVKQENDNQANGRSQRSSSRAAVPVETVEKGTCEEDAIELSSDEETNDEDCDSS